MFGIIYQSITHDKNMTGNFCVWLKVLQRLFHRSTVKRSPADGNGARPPVTSGSCVRSGKDWICDLISSLIVLTLSSLSLYISNLSSAWANKSFCAERKSLTIFPTLFLSFNSCCKRSLYSLSKVDALFTYKTWYNFIQELPKIKPFGYVF